MAVQPGLCRTWSETPKTGFLRTRLMYLTIIIDAVIPLTDSSDLRPFLQHFVKMTEIVGCQFKLMDNILIGALKSDSLLF